MKTSTLLAALCGVAVEGAVLWDGRFNDFTSSADLDKWSWANQVGPYLYCYYRVVDEECFDVRGNGLSPPSSHLVASPGFGGFLGVEAAVVVGVFVFVFVSGEEV
ncbi:hypothetical protein QBC40DRAFT_296612 [Triangularia verruculosa]|uniref:Uncharacterized protein n=1 Tax=Triangularia verruculosa TaxID=2587418 RepID=A0AAN6XL34_9PEZI|nr:hypothetical protein QBC40DRAFT_296612 [Triangularia verruculosa]